MILVIQKRPLKSAELELWTKQCKVFKEQFEFNIPCVDVEGSENVYDKDSGNV